MADIKKPVPGSVVWVDLTVPDAEKVKDFYKEAVNWNSNAFNMEEFCALFEQVE
jgi:predicted enzyme related to lactoylglutathione lyase